MTTTSHDKIKFLSQYRWLDREINRKLEEKERLLALACRVSPALSQEPKIGGSIYKQSDIVAKIVDLETEINADIDKLITLKLDIEAKIKAVESPKEQLVLRYRYIDCKRWEEIAYIMGYAWAQVHRIHKRAIEKMIHNDTLKSDIV